MTKKKPPKTKLPVVKSSKADAQRELAARPVPSASRPEFPTRGELYRKAGLLGGATLLAGGIAQATPAAGKPMPQQAVAMPSEGGTIDGKPIQKAAPKIKVYREGGGIGPSEDMWQLEDVEAFVSWTMAKEGNLAIQTKYKLHYDGLELELDGFDPDKNIGYEYVDAHDPDRKHFTPAVRAKLEAWMAAHRVAILFIEVKRYPDPATLKGKVVKFLHAVKQSPPMAGRLAGRK
jgi:hypothetical protein